jgi:cereblon
MIQLFLSSFHFLDTSQQEIENAGEGSSRSDSVDQSRSQAARTRRLVSQSTLREDTLDNSHNNSQQQFVDLDSSDSSDDSERDHDQLFEEYLRENAEAARSQACQFDNELPMNHTYLGSNMENIRGTNFYDPGKIYDMPVCGHHSLVFPGEILPMIMIAESIFAKTPESNEGLTFGLVFADEIDNEKVYGVTCQVFEKGVDLNGHITVKSKARQRFIVVRTEDGLTTQRNNNYYAKVRILPEYILPDPIAMNLSNNLKKFMPNQSQSLQIKNLLTSSMRWPKWVYDKYSIIGVNEKIERYLAMLSIAAPTDPILKSFWLARNVPLNQKDRLKIFTNNCVNKRMMLIADSLNFVRNFLFNYVQFIIFGLFQSQMCYFSCKRCKTKIAVYNDIFAMAKGNVNANYCNPAGYIHETLTVHKTLENSTRMVDRPSTEFSWFPG